MAEPILQNAAEAAAERRRRKANLDRKNAMIAYHRRNRLPDGRSASAVAGGMAAWRKRAEAHPGGARGLALDMAIARWYGGEEEPTP